MALKFKKNNNNKFTLKFSLSAILLFYSNNVFGFSNNDFYFQNNDKSLLNLNNTIYQHLNRLNNQEIKELNFYNTDSPILEENQKEIEKQSKKFFFVKGLLQSNQKEYDNKVIQLNKTVSNLLIENPDAKNKNLIGLSYSINLDKLKKHYYDFFQKLKENNSIKNDLFKQNLNSLSYFAILDLENHWLKVNEVSLPFFVNQKIGILDLFRHNENCSSNGYNFLDLESFNNRIKNFNIRKKFKTNFKYYSGDCIFAKTNEINKNLGFYQLGDTHGTLILNLITRPNFLGDFKENGVYSHPNSNKLIYAVNTIGSKYYFEDFFSSQEFKNNKDIKIWNISFSIYNYEKFKYNFSISLKNILEKTLKENNYFVFSLGNSNDENYLKQQETYKKLYNFYDTTFLHNKLPYDDLIKKEQQILSPEEYKESNNYFYNRLSYLLNKSTIPSSFIVVGGANKNILLEDLKNKSFSHDYKKYIWDKSGLCLEARNNCIFDESEVSNSQYYKFINFFNENILNKDFFKIFNALNNNVENKNTFQENKNFKENNLPSLFSQSFYDLNISPFLKTGKTNGTSFAAPRVSSSIGALQSIYPNLTNDNISWLLYSNAFNINPDFPVPNSIYGWGITDLGKSIKGFSKLENKDYVIDLSDFSLAKYINNFKKTNKNNNLFNRVVNLGNELQGEGRLIFSINLYKNQNFLSLLKDLYKEIKKNNNLTDKHKLFNRLVPILFVNINSKKQNKNYETLSDYLVPEEELNLEISKKLKLNRDFKGEIIVKRGHILNVEDLLPNATLNIEKDAIVYVYDNDFIQKNKNNIFIKKEYVNEFKNKKITSFKNIKNNGGKIIFKKHFNYTLSDLLIN